GDWSFLLYHSRGLEVSGLCFAFYWDDFLKCCWGADDWRVAVDFLLVWCAALLCFSMLSVFLANCCCELC
ncbi:unnamed protein product, partial [Ilex paraguariensis]